jgi:hypothetical protein
MDDPPNNTSLGPSLFPFCDGGPPPIPSEDPASARKLDFLGIYYQINCCAQRLLETRKRSDPIAERAALQLMEKALLARDALENECAPYGVAASPVMVNGFIADVRFSAPTAPLRQPSTVSMRFAVPPPPVVLGDADITGKETRQIDTVNLNSEIRPS